MKDIKVLSSINSNTRHSIKELEGLRRDLNQGLQELKKATEELNSKKKVKSEGDWRKVEILTEEQVRPLVKSDAQQALKKLDIL